MKTLIALVLAASTLSIAVTAQAAPFDNTMVSPWERAANLGK